MDFDNQVMFYSHSKAAKRASELICFKDIKGATLVNGASDKESGKLRRSISGTMLRRALSGPETAAECRFTLHLQTRTLSLIAHSNVVALWWVDMLTSACMHGLSSHLCEGRSVQSVAPDECSQASVTTAEGSNSQSVADVSEIVDCSSLSGGVMFADPADGSEHARGGPEMATSHGVLARGFPAAPPPEISYEAPPSTLDRHSDADLVLMEAVAGRCVSRRCEEDLESQSTPRERGRQLMQSQLDCLDDSFDAREAADPCHDEFSEAHVAARDGSTDEEETACVAALLALDVDTESTLVDEQASPSQVEPDPDVQQAACASADSGPSAQQTVAVAKDMVFSHEERIADVVDQVTMSTVEQNAVEKPEVELGAAEQIAEVAVVKFQDVGEIVGVPGDMPFSIVEPTEASAAGLAQKNAQPTTRAAADLALLQPSRPAARVPGRRSSCNAKTEGTVSESELPATTKRQQPLPAMPSRAVTMNDSQRVAADVALLQQANLRQGRSRQLARKHHGRSLPEGSVLES